MKPFNYHSHTKFSDGNNTPEEMIFEAIALGLDGLGFSEHFKSSIGCPYAMKKEDEPHYFEAVKALKEKYSDKIKIYTGIEADLTSPAPRGFDYVIGSVHYFHLGEEYIDVDESAEIQLDAASKYFGGDMIKLACHYFDEVASLPEKFDLDIVGHFDLVTKFNEDKSLFDENDARYKHAGEKAIERLADCGAVFEINTGAISRGFRTSPYPGKYFLNIIRECGARITYSSDSHSKDSIACAFNEAIALAKECGFKSMYKLTGDIEI